MLNEFKKKTAVEQLGFYIHAGLPDEAITAWYNELTPQEKQEIQDHISSIISEVNKLFTSLSEKFNELGQAIIAAMSQIELPQIDFPDSGQEEDDEC